MNESMLQIAINLLISGYLKNGEITAVPEVLRQLAEDWEKEIKAEMD